MGGTVNVLEWFTDPSHWSGPGGIPARLSEQLIITVVAVSVAALIALPIGIATGHLGKGSAIVTSIANLGRAIPTFALLLLLAAAGGVGVSAAIIALVIFAIPPILTNANIAIAQVDPQVRSAGRAMGFTGRQLFWHIEFPLGLPLIFAGLRTATVQVTATATLAALVGGGGLGRFILDGFALQDTTMVLAGVILVACVTMTMEACLAFAQALIARRIGHAHGGLESTLMGVFRSS
jgi:osmoprotectant transport system permease protein